MCFEQQVVKGNEIEFPTLNCEVEMNAVQTKEYDIECLKAVEDLRKQLTARSITSQIGHAQIIRYVFTLASQTPMDHGYK